MLRTEKECIDYIHSAGRLGNKAGLCNIRALLNSLRNPQKELKCIHIAGTNGKGSVSCMLSNILRECGYKVGMNTSPYIEVFNERLTINGENIPAEKLIYYTNLVAEAINNLKDIHPIEFEIITAIGFLYFKEEKCDYAIIECGIGGLLDSTNVIEDPALCVITRLGLDHTEILGHTMADIALQKAGIIKPNSVCVLHSEIEESERQIIKSYADKQGARVVTAEEDYRVISANLDYTDIYALGLKIRLKLLGSYQASNAALAIKCARELNIADDYIEKGIEKSVWMCRFERVGSRTIIDGAHNLSGIEALRDSVNMYLPKENRVFVIGMLNDKDFELSAKVLSELEGRFVVTDVPSVRQIDAKKVYDEIKKYIPNAIYESDYKKAVDVARTLAGDGGFVCIAGSLYLAGAVRQYLS